MHFRRGGGEEGERYAGNRPWRCPDLLSTSARSGGAVDGGRVPKGLRAPAQNGPRRSLFRGGGAAGAGGPGGWGGLGRLGWGLGGRMALLRNPGAASKRHWVKIEPPRDVCIVIPRAALE